MSKLVKEIMDALNAANMNKTQPYDRQGTVKRIEGKIAWVKLEGSDLETPVQMTIACDVGDTVQARIGGGSAWLTGNLTAPPTDDKKATQAMSMATTIIQQVKEEVDEALENLDAGGVDDVKIQYCLSNSASSFVKYGNWSDEPPAFVSGKYYWTRTVIVDDAGNITYGTPQYSQDTQLSVETDMAFESNNNHFWHNSSGAYVTTADKNYLSGYATRITSSGILQSYNGNLLSGWTNSGIAFYEGDGTTASNSSKLAEFGSSGANLYADNVSVASFGSTVRIGKSNEGHIEIDNTNLRFYNNATMFGRIRKGYYDRQMQIGTWKDDYTYGTLSLNGDDGKAVLTVQSGTSSSDNYSSLTMTPTAGSFTLGSDTSTSSSFDAILQLTANKLALYYGGVYDSDIKFSVIPSTGQLTLEGHSSPVGSQVTGTKVDSTSTAIPSSVNVSTGSGTSVAQLVLTKGTWIVYGQAKFASNRTGYRKLGFSSVKNNASTDIQVGASSSGATQIANTRVLTPSSQTTYYLNVTQNSGSTLAISDINFAAWRLI